MKSTKFLNNISDELKKQIPKLKPGEVITFQMLNGQTNPDPDEKERSKEPVLYGKKQLRTNYRIYDEAKGEYIDIGCVERWDGEKPERFRLFVPGMGEHSRFPGKFSLTGGNIKDEELYEILWLSPEREGSPCKDASIPVLFKIIDLRSDTKESVTRFDVLSKAIDIAKKLKADNDEKAARSILAALNQPTYQDVEVLMAKIKEMATTKPEIFIQVYENKETPVLGIIREAIDANILDHDLISGKVTIGGVTITTLKVQTSAEFIPAFVKWVGSAANGADVLSNIKKQLNKKEEPAA